MRMRRVIHRATVLAGAKIDLQRRVLQLGAGFIGCIIMEAIAAHEASLTVVEMGDRVLPRMMPEGAAALIKRWCETKGVRVLTASQVVHIDHAGLPCQIIADALQIDA